MKLCGKGPTVARNRILERYLDARAYGGGAFDYRRIAF
jgi:hypothetical protein